MGVVTDVVKRKVPASYAALVGATNNSYGYGVTDLYQISQLQQFKLFGTYTTVDNESTVYTPIEVELLGVLTTMSFIPAAVDFWGDQIISQNLTGTRESNAYLDRRQELWSIYDKLVAEAAELANSAGVAIKTAIIPNVSYGDNGRNILTTLDPACFPPIFDTSGNIYETWLWTDLD